MEEFLKLKDQKDVACTKINQVSKFLKFLLDKSQYGLWQERLTAEKILLENGKLIFF